jgi:ABC-2 type transport system ATP-binding protein
VFSELSLAANGGSTALLGPNGSGKTTLLGLGATVLKPRHGRVSVDGLIPDNRRNLRLYRANVGWMPQTIRAVPGLTAREQVAYAGWLKGMNRTDAWREARQALGAVLLGSLEGRTAATLSGGELRRVGLAQVLVHNPRAALLDEPTAGLDPAQRMQFREILTRLAERTALLVSTHQTDDLAAVFDKVAVLVAGRILFTGCVTEFLELGAESGVARGETAYMALLRRHSR